MKQIQCWERKKNQEIKKKTEIKKKSKRKTTKRMAKKKKELLVSSVRIEEKPKRKEYIILYQWSKRG